MEKKSQNRDFGPKDTLGPCIVPGCKDKTSQRHSFPLEEKVKNIWIERINSKELFNFCNRIPIPRCYKVCHSHFEAKCFGHSHRRLKRYSLPTLNLLHYKKTEYDTFYYPFHQGKPDDTTELVKSSISSNSEVSELHTIGPVKKPIATYSRKRPFIKSEPADPEDGLPNVIKKENDDCESPCLQFEFVEVNMKEEDKDDGD